MNDLGILLEEYITAYPEEKSAVEMLDFFSNDPNCFKKDNSKGHFTGSAWIVDPDRRNVLMTHHKKLDMWLQLGGHADGMNDLVGVALKESKEESGFDHFVLVDESIFDLDIHQIPAISKDPKHFHYDVRFLLEADPRKNNIIVSEESHDVKWIPLNEVLDINPEPSMQRMVKKTYALVR